MESTMTRHYRGTRTPLGNAVRLMAVAALAAVSATSFAAQTVEPGCPQTFSVARLFGEPASSVDGARTVRITPQTGAVSVHAGETVRFDFGATSAAWTFAARPGNTVVELVSLLPGIPAAKGIWVHQNGSNAFSGH
ncbi:CzcE family metal-binding protein [Cupriavidus sp. CuC1]|uniref:CzcE family metal-binding protein n=1 Tax=Cupriavidus sp. CuC1 TaxID=3373131 RepID=UPI0037D38BC9